jgi:hypothetical protein
MRWSRLILGCLFILMSLPTAGMAQANRPVDDAALAELQVAMADAANAFLASLAAPRREEAQFEFDNPYRTQFMYVPGWRAGLLIADMNATQRMRTHELLRTALSGHGYLKVTSIMQLEEVLRSMEMAGTARNVEGYALAVFGDPSPTRPWGWRFEGHHISLNFTSVEPAAISSAPLFLGSNPAEVRSGTWTGLRVLQEEEDVARALLMSLTDAQRRQAVFSAEAPNDIVTRTDPSARGVPRVGLPASAMSTDSRLLLLRLIDVYAGTLEPELAEPRLAAIREAGVDDLHFGWAGGTQRGEPHYYRIHGPTVLIEYDNVQTNANHIHSVWRDLQNDFGGDLLRHHYEHAPHHGNPQ